MESTVRESEGFLDTEEESEPGARERCIIGKLERRRGWNTWRTVTHRWAGPAVPPIVGPLSPGPSQACLLPVHLFNHTKYI
jgi:hypothetical protein